MVKVKTETAKVTPRTLVLIRKISAKTGEKHYRIFERLAQNEATRWDQKKGK